MDDSHAPSACRVRGAGKDWPTLRTRFLSSVAVALIFGFPSPAHATTVALLSISGANQPHARCPVTLPFTGVVTGPPNQAFEYWFVVALDGFRMTREKVTATMPATGVARVAGSLSIGVSTDAAQANHVQVVASAPGQSTPTLSNEVAFSITCGPPIFSNVYETTIAAQPTTSPRQTSTTIGASTGDPKASSRPPSMRTSLSGPTQTITLSATQQAVITAVAPGTFYVPTYSPLQVGYASFRAGTPVGEKLYNFARRVAFMFDTAPVRDRSIHRALLKFHVSASQVGLLSMTDAFWSCATSIGLADSQWYPAQSWITGTFNGPDPGRVRGPDIAIDVTTIVADWASGRASNHGFLLRGESENLGPVQQNACLSTVENPSLEVVYR